MQLVVVCNLIIGLSLSKLQIAEVSLFPKLEHAILLLLAMLSIVLSLVGVHGDHVVLLAEQVERVPQFKSELGRL
jgi:hypothetical protein